MECLSRDLSRPKLRLVFFSVQNVHWNWLESCFPLFVHSISMWLSFIPILDFVCPSTFPMFVLICSLCVPFQLTFNILLFMFNTFYTNPAHIKTLLIHYDLYFYSLRRHHELLSAPPPNRFAPSLQHIAYSCTGLLIDRSNESVAFCVSMCVCVFMFDVAVRASNAAPWQFCGACYTWWVFFLNFLWRLNREE